MSQTTIYIIIIAFAALAIVIAAVLYVGIKQIKALTSKKHHEPFITRTIKSKQLQH
jgi:hypothetical protein